MKNKGLIGLFFGWFLISFIIISISLIINKLNLLLISFGQFFLIMGLFGYSKIKNKMILTPSIIGAIMIGIVVIEKFFKTDIFTMLMLFVPLFLFIIGLFLLLSSNDSKKKAQENFIINTKLIVKNIEYKEEIWYSYLEYNCNDKTFNIEEIFEFEEDIPYKIGDEIDIVVDKTNYENYMYLWEKNNTKNNNNKIAYFFMTIGFIVFIAILLAI